MYGIRIGGRILVLIRVCKLSMVHFHIHMIIGVLFLQIRILVIFSLTSGYQPIVTKFSANVAYFSKLNLTFLPKITNELISDICSEVIRIFIEHM